jgi:transcriptional regulator with XRE-family HTH domain
MGDYEPNLRLRHAIIDDGRLTRDIAQAVGVAAPYLSGIVTGRVTPGPATRARIADVLGHPEHDLFDPTPPPSPARKVRPLSDAEVEQLRRLLPAVRADVESSDAVTA